MSEPFWGMIVAVQHTAFLRANRFHEILKAHESTHKFVSLRIPSSRMPFLMGGFVSQSTHTHPVAGPLSCVSHDWPNPLSYLRVTHLENLGPSPVVLLLALARIFFYSLICSTRIPMFDKRQGQAGDVMRGVGKT